MTEDALNSLKIVVKIYKNNYTEVGWQSPDEYMRTWQQWDAELKRELHFAVRLRGYFQNA